MAIAARVGGCDSVQVLTAMLTCDDLWHAFEQVWWRQI